MQVSGYPSNSQFINISGDTMTKEILGVTGINQDVAKLQNINLMFGKINSLEYCNTMFNFPTLHELYTKYISGKLPDLNNIKSDEFDLGDFEEKDED